MNARSAVADLMLYLRPFHADSKMLRDLLEVVDEELLRFLAELFALAGAAERGFVGEQLLELLRERRLADAALADAEQLDLAVERRVLAIVDRADDVVRGGERLVAIELAARERHEVRRVQARVLRVDRDEHLDDVIFGNAIEDDRRHGERLVAEAIDVGVQREQAVLAVDRAQDAFALRHLRGGRPTSRFRPARSSASRRTR